ncbi:hypothetical protein H312_02332 [Anncaliia algerae PRA339]|uniref:RNase P subunit p30 n=1 Tax=Anncaliia algerae PRA339 TaxID=1288291 RepID=A0A059EZU9_9MICR|nr:hypothetical protein H312_02332 [Anncaliia algerae PRA339]
MFNKNKINFLMTYEIDINENFTDHKSLLNMNYKGICINKEFTPGDKLSEYNYFQLPFSVYKKLTLNLTVNNTKSPIKLPQHDILSASCDDQPTFHYICEKYDTDLISLDLSKPLFLIKESMVRKAVQRNIFFEIKMVYGLYSEKTYFIRNVQTLLNYTKGKNIIFSSGAHILTELKTEEDIMCFLSILNVKNSWLKRIKENKEKFFCSVAAKKYIYKSCVVSEVDEGPLKRDFILSKFDGL